MRNLVKVFLFTSIAILLVVGYQISLRHSPEYTFTDLGEIGIFENLTLKINDKNQTLLYGRDTRKARPVDWCEIWQDGQIAHSFDQGDFGGRFLVSDFNNRGEFVGLIGHGQSQEGFRWSPEVGLTLFPVRYIASINDHGSMAGTVVVSEASVTQPCIISPTGEVKLMIAEFGEGSAPMVINNSGEVLMSLKTEWNASRRYALWANEKLIELDLDSSSTINGIADYPLPVEMNEAGEMVGWTRGGNVFHWASDKGFSFLLTEDYIQQKFAHGINDRGMIVGSTYYIHSRRFSFLPAWLRNNTGSLIRRIESRLSTAQVQAVIWKDGQYQRLQDMAPKNTDLTLNCAVAINDNGWVGGYGLTTRGKTHAFLLTPIDAATD